MSQPLVLIAAVGRNRAIGQANRLPWRLKSDLQRFRSVTMGRPVIVGRKTFEAIGRPLPGRHLVVLSGSRSLPPDPAVVGAATLEEALARAVSIADAVGAPEIVVAGGAEIYAQTIARAARLDLTLVDLEPPADAWFPPIDPALWEETSREAQVRGPHDDADFSFVRFDRRPAGPEAGCP